MFPIKFKEKLETTLNDVAKPDKLWLTYSVCGVETNSCGWSGWVLESVKSNGSEVQAQTDLKCPKCMMPLFRTQASLKYEPSIDQSRDLIEGKDYEVTPIEYE